MIESISTLVIATALLLGSPGPAPLALAATGAAYGFRAGIPFLLGILSGLAVAIVLGSLGIAALFEAVPSSRLAMQVVGGLYIVYVAIKIATGPVVPAQSDQRVAAPGFRDGFILNVLNPKAYAAFLALFAQFLLPLSTNLISMLATALIAYGVAVIIDFVWLALGQALRPLFETPKTARVIRVVFGVLMVIAVMLTFFAG